MSQISDEDKSLFEAAVTGARKLKEGPKTETFRPKRSTRIRPKSNLDEITFGDAASQATMTPVSAYESLLFERPGIRPQELRKLRRGDFKPSGKLDLHGQTEREAEQSLLNFLHSAEKKQARYVLIIHGKGHHSDSERPILKNLINWRLPQFDSVLAFCSAQPKDGGAGAVYVMLRKPTHDN